MKKLLPLLTLCMSLCCVSCYDDSPILERLDALEKNAIASINEQISAIKSSLTSLETVDKELKATIQSLEAKDGTLQSEIEGLKTELSAMEANDLVTESEIASLKLSIQALEDKDKAIIEELEDLTKADSTLLVKVDDLTKYLNDELTTNKNWANATFSTLEQHDSLCVVLVGIETSINNLEKELSKALSDAISESEESIKRWVNEQLTGYWTIAETEAKLDTLKANHDTEIASIKEELKTTADDLTTAYKDAIAEAIEDSEGRLSTKIDDVNTALEKKISDIEARLTAVEEKLKDLTREFAIVFDDNEVGILAGGTTSVGYTITGATDKTTVKALGQNGWSAKVTPNGTNKGTITVTAPNPMSDDEIIVLVYDGEFRTIMSTINFVTGVVTPSQSAVELEAEAGTIDITITSNLNYEIFIPNEAREWLSVVESKSIRNDIITFAFHQNDSFKRAAKVSIKFEDSTVSNIGFIQKGLANGITVDKAGTLLSIIENEDLWDAEKLKISGELNDDDWKTIKALTNTKYLDLTDITNQYLLDRQFKGNSILEVLLLPQGLLEIPESLCEDCTKLQAIRIPSNVIRIGKNAFKNTYEVQGDLVIPDSVVEIMDGAFWASHDVVNAERYNINLYGSLHIGKNVTTIGAYAFARNGYYGTLIIPDSVNYIGDEAFRGGSYSELKLSANLKRIQKGTFAACDFEGEIVIPEGVEYIEGNAFEYCYDITGVKFPLTLKELVGNTNLSEGKDSYGQGSQFGGCSKLKDIVIPTTITYIPALAFAATGLSGDLIIPDNIIEVGCGAFCNCFNIKTVTLGKNLQYLRTATKYPNFGWGGADTPFDGCSGIQKIYCKNPIPPICEHSLPITSYLGVPKDAVETYKTAEVWKDFSVIVGMDF